MNKVSSYETIDPATLSQQALVAFQQRLYAIHCQIFAGVDIAQFVKKVFDIDAKWTKIRIFKDKQGQAVGYCALHAYGKVINSKKVIIFRTQIGVLKDYRKQGNISAFFIKEVLKYKALHPFEKSYLFCTLVHPSSYHLLSNFFPRYYPSISYATPQNERDRMQQMAEAFHAATLPNIDPPISEVGWITRQTAEEQSEWANSRNPNIRFFLSKNPNYHKGQGLVTLAPVQLKSLIYGALKKRIMARK